MKLFNFYAGTELHLGATDGQRWVDVTACYPIAMQDVISDQRGEHLPNIANIVRKGRPLTPESMSPSGRLHFAPAVVDPEKIICVGLNYEAHRDEAGMGRPEYPALFSKFNNALNAHNHPLILPDTATEFDYEAELVIVIGRPARKVSRAAAPDYIFGYTCGNDFSARDLQRRTPQWLLGKTCDGFAPIGPCIVTADSIDPQNLAIKSYVNGELRQDGNTRDMIFDCATIVSYISDYFTLRPGDIIFTGTPQGVILGQAEEQRRWLKAGDIVTVAIEGIGELTTPLR